jgi:hypothetical protein
VLPVLRHAESWALVTRRYSASLVELLEGLLLAAKAEGVRVYLGMGNPSGNAWDCMGFPEGNNFSHSAVEYYDTYYRVQRDIATELWQRYAASYAGIIAGFYLNREVGARDHSSLRAI